MRPTNSENVRERMEKLPYRGTIAEISRAIGKYSFVVHLVWDEFTNFTRSTALYATQGARSMLFQHYWFARVWNLMGMSARSADAEFATDLLQGVSIIAMRLRIARQCGHDLCISTLNSVLSHSFTKIGNKWMASCRWSHSQKIVRFLSSLSSLPLLFHFPLLNLLSSWLLLPPQNLTNNRYIGGENSAKNKSHLKQLGIKCVVNCTSHVPNFFPDEFVYLHSSYFLIVSFVFM